MSEFDRRKWDEKYGSVAQGAAPTPASWLLDHLPCLPRGRAIDVATGLGAVAIALSSGGWTVTAVDISAVAIARAKAFDSYRRVNWLVADLDTIQFPSEQFELVTVFNYLDRDRMPREVVRSLRPGGTLVFETFSHEQLRRPDNHIKNPDHVLRTAELLSIFPGLRVRRYREVNLADRAVASLIAEKPAG